jgi:hypothetical protein
MRPVLLGMNNPISSDPRHALYPAPPGCAGWNLRKYSGLTDHEYLARFDRRNILSQRKWEKREALAAADALIEELRGRRVVILGVETAVIMRLSHLQAFRWQEAPGGGSGQWSRIPHPSGLCREWNDPLVRACAEVFLQEVAAWQD